MKSLVVFLLGLAAGAAALVTVQRVKSEVKPPDQAAMKTPATGEVVAVASADPVTNAMELAVTVDDPEREIRILRRQLEVRERELARLRGANGQPDATATNPAPRRPWLEDLKTTDPDRYKEVMERREQGRQATKYEIAKRAAYFLGRDQSALGEEEMKQRDAMLALLEESLNLTEKIRSEMPEEERRDISRTLRDNLRQLSPMLETERFRELHQLGRDMGYSEKDAAEFVLMVNDILDVTSVSSIFRDSMRQMNGWESWGRRDGERDARPPRPAP